MHKGEDCKSRVSCPRTHQRHDPGQRSNQFGSIWSLERTKKAANKFSACKPYSEDFQESFLTGGALYKYSIAHPSDYTALTL